MTNTIVFVVLKIPRTSMFTHDDDDDGDDDDDDDTTVDLSGC